MRKLTRCSICSFPSILLKMPEKLDIKTLKRPWKEAQGPTTNKRIKKWCRGTCFGILIPVWMEISDLTEYLPKIKSKKHKKFVSVFIKRLRQISKEQEKAVVRLMQSV